MNKYISCKICPYCVKKPFNTLHCLIYAMDVKKLDGCPITDWGDCLDDISDEDDTP